MNYLQKFHGHLSTINRHRFTVAKLCFQMGLYIQGLTHDLSKYSFTEFWSSVKYYQGNRSPIEAEREDIGVSLCWLHHQGHNKHHWQYWIDFFDNDMVVQEIPLKYIKEMVCDRTAACIIYQKDKYKPSSALDYYKKGIEQKYLPPRTKYLLEKYLTIISEHDNLKDAIKIIKEDNGYYPG